MNKPTILLQLICLCLLVTTGCSAIKDNSDLKNRSVSSYKSDVEKYDSFTKDVKPILDNRCAVCHSCYNSPCQLNLASYEGFDRGANKVAIYDFDKVRGQKPTRLFEDAHSSKAWQKDFGFFPVYIKNKDGSVNLEMSQFHKMLELKKDNPNKVGAFDSENSASCPEVKNNKNSNKQMREYAEETPWGGMPYGLPALSPTDLESISSWLASGAPGPIASQEKDPNSEQILKWEAFLNNPDPKHQLTSRYLFEHLFLGHLYLNENPKNFYKLVRAKNEIGIPDVYTEKRRPYAKIGRNKSVYYRLRKVTSTIMHKTHIVYPLTDKKLARYKELFIETDWNTDKIVMPPYEKKYAANPLVTFEQMPAKSRYKFLLDNAQYFIMNFIRGPVCRGNVALNVIDDNFWVTFVDPDSDIFTTNIEAMDYIKGYGATPAAHGSHLNPLRMAGFYKQSSSNKNKIRKAKNKMFNKFNPNGYKISDIWDGDGHNDNALLTIYRHTDSATVVKGALGATPKTLWILDYPILEDIYYNLVAGYDVFGATDHQVKTRIHMDNSRINGQDNFIDMLPLESRGITRFNWTRNEDSVYKPENFGLTKKVNTKNQIQTVVNRDAVHKMKTVFPYLGAKRKTSVKYTTNNHKQELIDKMIKGHLSKFYNKRLDKINRSNIRGPGNAISSSIPNYDKFNREAGKVFGKKLPYASYFPNFSILKVTKKGEEDKVYSIIHHKEHWNVSFLFDETSRRRPEHDVIDLYPGIIGSYPNYIFKVNFDDLSYFLRDVQKVKSRNSYLNFANTYGVKRMNDKRYDFWKEFDEINAYFRKTNPLEAGLLDLNRYHNY